MMEIVESTDSFPDNVYKIVEDHHLIAVFYNRGDAETAKTALEKERSERSKRAYCW